MNRPTDVARRGGRFREVSSTSCREPAAHSACQIPFDRRTLPRPVFLWFVAQPADGYLIELCHRPVNSWDFSKGPPSEFTAKSNSGGISRTDPEFFGCYIDAAARFSSAALGRR